MMKIFLKGKQIWGFLKLRIKKEDVKNMTRERANAIFYRDYYKWNGLNKLPLEHIGLK